MVFCVAEMVYRAVSSVSGGVPNITGFNKDDISQERGPLQGATVNASRIGRYCPVQCHYSAACHAPTVQSQLIGKKKCYRFQLIE